MGDIPPELAPFLLEKASRDGKRADLGSILRLLIEPCPGEFVSAHTINRLMVLFYSSTARTVYRDLLPVMESMGAMKHERLEVRGWLGVKLRRGVKRAEKAVIEMWERRVALPKEPTATPKEFLLHKTQCVRGSATHRKVQALETRKQIHEGHFRVASEYFWKTNWTKNGGALEKEIWRLYSIEGLTTHAIKDQLGLKYYEVQQVIARHKVRSGLRMI